MFAIDPVVFAPLIQIYVTELKEWTIGHPLGISINTVNNNVL
jgi:hypothetical protein